MTKLEEKLIELGYKQRFNVPLEYFKWYEKTNNITEIQLTTCRNKINNYRVYTFDSFKSQQDIDNLQKAFNQLQNDLEVLKEYE